MWEPYSVDFSDFDGEVYTISSESHDWSGYDTWVHSFDPNDEIMLLQTLIQRAEENPLFRAHIRGISLAESTHIL
jgi:Na+-transporting NADH:ubiquinone oxidoreductase subunit NqrF